MLKFISKLEHIAISSSANKIVLEMQEHKWVKKLSSVIQTNYMKGNKKNVYFFISTRKTKDQSLHH